MYILFLDDERDPNRMEFNETIRFSSLPETFGLKVPPHNSAASLGPKHWNQLVKPGIKDYHRFISDIYYQEFIKRYAGMENDEGLIPIICCKNYDTFVSCIEDKGLPYIVTFDHDLGDFKEINGEMIERTGKTCAEWICNYCMDNVIPLSLPTWIIHTKNNRGIDNIESYLRNFERINKN